MAFFYVECPKTGEQVGFLKLFPFFKKAFALFALASVSFAAAGQVSGTVFRDFNANGTKQNSSSINEIGLPGVVVSAFNPAGAALTVSYTGGGTKTNSTGGYAVSGGTLGQIRLEFTLPDNYTFATKGAAGGTTVMFPTAATQDLAVNYPSDYCHSTNPQLATPCYINGDPLGGGTAADGDSFVGFPFEATDYDAPTNLHSKADSIGATWGLAYQRSTQTLFTSAFLKRHVGLGPLGIGGIYKAGTGTTPSATRWLDVKTIGIDVGTVASNGVRGLPATKEDPSHDAPAVFDLIGKIGMGDLDISEDGKVLFLTNLYDRKLYSIVIDSDNNPATKPTAADVRSYSIPNPGCANGVSRPWAIKIYKGKVYVGVVCTAENASGTVNDMFAYIYSMDISGGLAMAAFSAMPVFSMPLNYPKLPVEAPDGPGWQSWTADYTSAAWAFTNEGARDRAIRPQPILADIEFDVDSSMILIFNDRAGHQFGFLNYSPDAGSTQLYNAEIGGDILRVANVNGAFQLEHNGTAGALTSADGVGNGGGPGTLSGNSYVAPFGEFYDDLTIATVHNDCVQGGSALLPGSGKIIACQMDPINWTSGGLMTWSNTDGTQVNRYELYASDSNVATFGKANGLGDLEFLCNAQPIEVGNRVWADTDHDGKQDAGEPGIDGVTVELFKGTTKVGATLTANGGEYFFTDANVNLGGATGILPGMAYEIRILSSQTAFGGKVLTQADASSNGMDLIDSDGSLVGPNAVKAFTSGDAGQNVHAYDFGYHVCTAIVLGPSPLPGGMVGTPYSTQITATGGAGPYQFLWYPGSMGPLPAGLSMSASGLVSGTPTTPGSYSAKITVLDANMCPDTLDPAAIAIPAAPCQITVVSATPSACDAANQTYSLTAVVNYSTPPTGNINITTSNGGSISVAQTGSPQTINLTGLTSDGVANIDVTAVFDSDGACTNTLADAYSAPFSCYMQMQSEFTTPTILTACNLDTICLTISNQKGLKNATYGNVTIDINIPDGDLIGLVPGSVYSITAGAVQTSYVNDVLTVTTPMPAFGDQVKICFAIRPDCDITSLTPLPQFHATIDYPAGYPMPYESVSSAPMNVGAVQMAHSLYDQTTYGNPSPAFGAGYPIISWLQNTGFGSQKEVIYKTVIPNSHAHQIFYVFNLDGVDAQVYSAYNVAPVVSSVPYATGHTLRTYKFSGFLLGPDGLFTPGERLRLDNYSFATQVCSTFTAKRWAEISCGDGEPLCQAPDTLFSNIYQAAGTPKLAGTLVSIEQADGCPEKHGIFTVKNTGVGNAAPVGNAYDVDLGISFGGGVMILSNIELNGIAVPAAHLTPNGLAATTTTIKLKDLMTTDPDGAGGISDLDGDGFFDDMLVGAETEVSFDYTVPCNLACGSQLDYNLTSFNTFTDYCRTLVGATSTPLHRFGFEQVQAIEQLEQVDYGALTTGQSVTKTAKFRFQYKQHNMDFTNASGELHIKYWQRMELNPATILINGAAPTNPPVLYGTNTAGMSPDNDSMYVVTLTPAELTALFDGTSDQLWYDQTYYGCNPVRQDSKTGDTWQLFVKVKQDPCSDNSSACAFDVSCKKPFVYTYNTGCGTKPCYVQTAKIYREALNGYTDVSETTPISPIDSLRSWTGDTVVYNTGFFITGDDSQEPNGFYTSQGKPHLDLRQGFSINYSKPKGWNGPNTIWKFLPTISSVSVYHRTPDPAFPLKKGTVGAKIIEASIILGDFSSTGGATSATMQGSFNTTEYDYGDSEYGDPEWYCTNSPNSWHVKGSCPVFNKYWYDLDYTNIHHARYQKLTQDKMTENYYLNFGRALARAGWTGDAGDDNFYFEINTRWEMDENFPWDNTNSFSATGYLEHLGDYQSYPTSYSTDIACSYNGSCGNTGATHLTVEKEHFISNPNDVYYGDCDLKVHHDVFFETYEGDYFRNNEVRVPLKIDSIVIDLPSEYGLTAGTFNWKYNQSCGDLNSTAVSASALAGHIKFTNTAGGDFPRADDCSGNKMAYQLCYNIAKTGSAAPTQYKFPIKIYGRDEFDKIQIFKDSATIAEAKPELVLTPLTPVLTPADGGPCQPAFFDFKIQNNTLYDAGNVYFAAESTPTASIVWVNDGTNVYPDPIDSADVSPYGGNKLFVKIGSIKAGDVRIVRVLANTTSCVGDIKVFTDFGCAYPTPLEPVASSPTLDIAVANYMAQTPGITTLPKTPINIASMCDVKSVEVDVRNIRFGNLYDANVLFDLPAGATMVAGSAKYRFKNTADYAFVNVPPADVTQPAADKVNISLANLNPFNTDCGLPGADEFTSSSFKIKFDIEFSACPTASKDYILYTASAENYCGTKSSSQGVIQLNYIGTTAATNNYTLAYSASPIEICAYMGEAQAVKDTIVLKNIGGYGTASGPSTGMEMLEFTVILDTTRFQVSDFTLSAPFNAPTFSYDANGNLVIHTNVPGGIKVDTIQTLVMTYTLKPKVADLCKSTTPEMCYSGVVKSSPDLSCPAKSLVCAANFVSIQGHKFAVRPFKCCFVALGNLVFMDTDMDGIFTAGTDMGVNGVTVQLFKEGDDPATATPIATKTTVGGGFYLFDQLDQGKYFVFIPASNFASGLPLDSKKSSTPEGGDDTTDDSGNENGQNTLVSGGVTSTVIDLRSNQEPTGETGAGTYPGTLADNRVNMTVDFGFSCIQPDVVAHDTTICGPQTIDLATLFTHDAGAGNLTFHGSKADALANAPSLAASQTPSATTEFFVKKTSPAGCFDIDSIDVTVVQPVSAGTATNPADICQAASGLTFVNLFAQLAGETTGGVWSKTSGPNAGINFDAGAGTFDPNGLPAGAYVFEYVVSGISPCPNDSEQVTVTIKDCTLPCPPKVCLPITTAKKAD